MVSDPATPTSPTALPGAGRTDALPEAVDVLIIGCGPTGLTLAAQLAAFPDITTAIVDQKAGPIELGQADGIACRSMEMFEAFGIADRVLREAYFVNETAFWKPGEANRAEIVRSGRIQDVEDGLSEMPHVILNQARVHDFYLDLMRNAPSRLEPHYQRQFLDLAIAPTAPPCRIRSRCGSTQRPWARGPDRDGQGQIRGRLRRRAQRGAQGDRPGTRRRFRQPGLGRHGRARGHRLSRHPSEVPDPVGGRRQRPDHSARGRLSLPHLHRARKTHPQRTGREPERDARTHHRRRAAHPPPLHARGEGDRLVVGVRDRPAALRQVRRRRRRRGPHAARLHRRRRLPYPQRQGRPGHEHVDAGHVQPRLEAGLGSARARRSASAQDLFAGAPADRQRVDRLRSRLLPADQRAAQGSRRTRRAKASNRPSCSGISSRPAGSPPA